ncbi:MAG: serine/threonine protein kinase [Chloroflexi bacterium]|nr:serine/threonine protein kinase [Chloroflexota bacterium]
MAIPEKIGRYQIKDVLGHGGMAVVYQAYDPSFDREVAVKVLPREVLHDPHFRSRFEREFKIVAGLEHPAIAPVYDVGEENGQPYFVMRYMTGGSLAGWIHTKGKISLQDTARVIEKVALGLAYAHKKGVVHRDLKPDNILFDGNGDPFISDFGVANLTESTTSAGGTGIVGSPAYMSPEQAKGSEADSLSDIYSLGVIVYQMLSGQQPFHSDTPMGVVVKHIIEPIPEILKSNPDLPPEVDFIIKNALAKDKTRRYSTALELARALNLAAFGVEGNIGLKTTSALNLPDAQQPRGRMGLLVAAIVLTIIVVGFFLLRNQLLVIELPPTPTSAPVLETVTVQATTTVPMQAVTPTLEVVPTTAFAPFCAEEITIAEPFVRVTNFACIRKRPYTTVTIPDDATFELTDPQATCISEAVSNGRRVLSCSGPSFLVYDLKVCVPPVIPESDLNKCSTGDTFDSTNQCCIAAPPQGAGCTIFVVKLKGC